MQHVDGPSSLQSLASVRSKACFLRATAQNSIVVVWSCSCGSFILQRVKLLAVLCFLSPQAVVLLGCLSFVAYYYKRHKWSVLKSRKIVYRPSPHSWRLLWSEKIEITFTQIVSAMNDNKNLLTFWSVPYSLVNAKVLLSAPSHVPVFFFELLHRACLNAICWADCYFAVHDDYWFFVLLIPRAYLLLRKCCEVHVLVKGIITFCFVI